MFSEAFHLYLFTSVNFGVQQSEETLLGLNQGSLVFGRERWALTTQRSLKVYENPSRASNCSEVADKHFWWLHEIETTQSFSVLRIKNLETRMKRVTTLDAYIG